MIEIKDISGKVKFSTPINVGAKGRFMLMKEDYITIPFSTDIPVDLKRGDYVDLRGVFDDALGGKLAKVYKYLTLQNPSVIPGKYSYELRFDAYYYEWNTKIFKFTPESHGQEAGWNLTAPLDIHLGLFLRNLKANGYTYNGVDYIFDIDSTVENKAFLMTYDNIHLLDALFSMASKDKWNCDCWITDNVIHFGRCEFGDAVDIELGVEAAAMTRSESKGTYATRVYVFGGTRNIPANYRPVDEQAVVNGVVQKRLMLPEGTPCIDAYPGMTDTELSIEIERESRRLGSLGIFRIFGQSMEIFMGSLLAGDNADAPSPYDFALGGAGLDASLPVGGNGTPLTDGTSVMVDMGGNFTGYMTDMTRVFSVGKLTDRAYKAHDTALEIQRRIEQTAAPGVPAADLYNLAVRIAADAGLSDYFMGHRQQAGFIGHGIGIEINEAPVLAPRSKEALVPGMVFALEPKFVIPSVGAVGIENSFLVTDNGIEKLTHCEEAIVPLQ